LDTSRCATVASAPNSLRGAGTRERQLRENLTPYDAAYVALAELAGTILLIGDERITAAPALRCETGPCHRVPGRPG
jgi:predicted nucleic acid-binding protein